MNKTISAGFKPQKLIETFSLNVSKSTLFKAEDAGKIPKASRKKSGAIDHRSWSNEDAIPICALYGNFPKPDETRVIATYVPKGGTGKTAWTFNLSRILAFHGIRVLAVGLDFQCSLSKSFGINYDLEELPCSLFDCIIHGMDVTDIIHESDLPTLDFIPESNELTMLDRSIAGEMYREIILSRILSPLKKEYDVIILDCPPQWSEMVTNSLVFADSIVCPILADGESYHSFKNFMKELKKFCSKGNKAFDYVKFIPNQVKSSSKYSKSFKRKFQLEYPDLFTESSIVSSTYLPESGTAGVSILEKEPKSPIARDVYEAAKEVWLGMLDREEA